MIDFRVGEPDGIGRWGRAINDDGQWMGIWYECIHCPDGQNIHLDRDHSEDALILASTSFKFGKSTHDAFLGRLCPKCARVHRKKLADERRAPPPEKKPERLGKVIGFGVNKQPIYRSEKE